MLAGLPPPPYCQMRGFYPKIPSIWSDVSHVIKQKLMYGAAVVLSFFFLFFLSFFQQFFPKHHILPLKLHSKFEVSNTTFYSSSPAVSAVRSPTLSVNIYYVQFLMHIYSLISE